MIGDRPISDVLQDIVRSEVRLAKAEIREDATQAAASALWMTYSRADGTDDEGERRMDETLREIETHIDRTRDRLGSNLKELEARVDAATDWREQFRARPYVALVAACVGGALLAAALRTKKGPWSVAPIVDAKHGTLWRPGVEARGQALELWESIQTAFLGLGAARVKGYIGELVPGFEDHLRRAEQRRSVGQPTGLR